MAEDGYKAVVNLRCQDEADQPIAPDREGEVVASLGLEYRHLPMAGGAMSDELVDEFRASVEALPKPVLVHCASGKRAGAFTMMHLAAQQGMGGDATLQQAASYMDINVRDILWRTLFVEDKLTRPLVQWYASLVETVSLPDAGVAFSPVNQAFVAIKRAAAADAVEEALSALETAETQRLAELTAQLSKTADPLRTALEAVAALDAARARALCGFDDLQGVVPESGACLDLVGARDPTLLLDAAVDSVVPIDVIAAKGGAVVVSGPNGGGKTSLLRTVGLAAILTRLGVPVPATRAAVPAYQCVLADVDGAARTAFPQRSTYEARCRTLAAALAADDVLALLDELGGATDVAEGAAVATAALDALCTNGATTVCATHVAALKALPARDSRYVSLAFRVDEAGRPFLHHLLEKLHAGWPWALALQATLFQFAYTSVFGAYLFAPPYRR
mgnify:CR=1 FL=1